MNEYLWTVVDNYDDEHIIYVSPNQADCIRYAKAFFENTEEPVSVQKYYYKIIHNRYLAD